MQFRTYDEVDAQDVAWLNRVGLRYEFPPPRGRTPTSSRGSRLPVEVGPETKPR